MGIFRQEKIFGPRFLKEEGYGRTKPLANKYTAEFAQLKQTITTCLHFKFSAFQLNKLNGMWPFVKAKGFEGSVLMSNFPAQRCSGGFAVSRMSDYSLLLIVILSSRDGF
jgi:hypothetical protein